MRSLLLASLLLLTACGCVNVVSKESAEGDDSSAADEAQLATDFAKSQEARAWIARQDTFFFEASKEQATEVVEKLYAAGSPMVKVTDAELDKELKKEIAATLAAELPTDATKRAAVFKVQADLYGEEDADKDTGQKYLTVVFD